MHTSPNLTTLPLEILNSIAYHLATTDILGPPIHLIPLLLTCRSLNAALSLSTNPHLYARIFRTKFDSGAITRRAFTPTSTQCSEQLVLYCRTLQVLRAGDVFVAAVTMDTDPCTFDRNAGEALHTAFMMLLEDDGANAAQLLGWAHADVFAERFVRRRVYEGRERNEGWPIENGQNACALWVMWMLTSQEQLQKETVDEREQMIKLLLPFVIMPLRYPTSDAPPHFFPINPSTIPTLPTLPNTFTSPHGPYPPYPHAPPSAQLDPHLQTPLLTPGPHPRTISPVHFSTRPAFTYPLASPAAKLLYFARRELTPLPAPPHLAPTRAHAHAAGNFEMGATLEDLREVNWSWTVRRPLGAGVGANVGVGVGVGVGSSSSGTSTTNDTSSPLLTWQGKAPHSLPRREKSRLWDTDWWRLRLCGDPLRPSPRVRYGSVYKPGCMDGLWVGRMLITDVSLTQYIMSHPTHPPPGILSSDTPIMQAVVYMRLHEAHAVAPSASASASASAGDGAGEGAGEGLYPGLGPRGVATRREGAIDDGIANAWFPGEVGSVRVGVEDDEGEGEDEDEGEYGNGNGKGRGRGKKAVVHAGGVRGVYKCWEGRGRRGYGEPELEEGGEEEWEGYPHDEGACLTCVGRRDFEERERIREEREERLRGESEREREVIFGSVGLGLEGDDDDDEDEDDEGEDGEETNEDTPFEVGEDEDEDEDEEEEDQWDPPGDTLPAQSISPLTGLPQYHPALPRTHVWRRRGRGRGCDGVKEVVLFGETEERHGDAWGHYKFYGRVREWDGLVGILRVPRDAHNGYLFFYGYLVGGENFVGNWRVTSADQNGPVWECGFAMSRRGDC